MSEAPFSQMSDAELISTCQKGTELAFAELVRRYKEKAMQLAFVTVGNFEDAKDVSQEAFVKASRALANFEGRAEFSTWFYRIVMNTAKDFLRRKKWARFLGWKSSEEMDSFFETVPGRGVSPGQNAIDHELGGKITECINQLPFKQKWMFTLRYMQGFSLQEIAEVTELSEGTVKATLHFAVQKFKQSIWPYVQEGGHVS